MTGKLRAVALTLVATLLCATLALLMPTSHVSGRAHGGATRGLDCGTCHTPDGWRMRDDVRTAKGFDHDLTGFPLRAGHKAAACRECHDGSGPAERACASCHVDAHGGKLGQNCDRCHTANSWRSTDAFTLHSQTRLPLTGMHALVDCADCHRRQSSDNYTTVPSQCFACHEGDYRNAGVHPVHDGSKGDPPFPRNCAECHRTDAFSPALIAADRFLRPNSQMQALDARQHDRHFLLSRGPHRGAPCASCHVEMSAPRIVRCTGCHAHGTAQLAAQHPQTGAPGDGSCLACHAGGFAR